MTFAADLSSYDPDAFAKEQELSAAGWRFAYPSSWPTSDGLVRAEVLLTAPDGESTYSGEGLSEGGADARMRASGKGCTTRANSNGPNCRRFPMT